MQLKYLVLCSRSSTGSLSRVMKCALSNQAVDRETGILQRGHFHSIVSNSFHVLKWADPDGQQKETLAQKSFCRVLLLDSHQTPTRLLLNFYQRPRRKCDFESRKMIEGQRISSPTDTRSLATANLFLNSPLGDRNDSHHFQTFWFLSEDFNSEILSLPYHSKLALVSSACDFQVSDCNRTPSYSQSESD